MHTTHARQCAPWMQVDAFQSTSQITSKTPPEHNLTTGGCCHHSTAHLEADQVTNTTPHDTKLAVTGCEDTVLQGSKLYSEYCSDARAHFGTGRRLLLHSAAHDEHSDEDDADGPEVQSKPWSIRDAHAAKHHTTHHPPAPPSVWHILSKPTYRVASPYELQPCAGDILGDAYVAPEPPLLWENEE